MRGLGPDGVARTTAGWETPHMSVEVISLLVLVLVFLVATLRGVNMGALALVAMAARVLAG